MNIVAFIIAFALFLGGMALFGINGFVIGPVIAALFMAAWSLFANSGDVGDHHNDKGTPI